MQWHQLQGLDKFPHILVFARLALKQTAPAPAATWSCIITYGISSNHSRLRRIIPSLIFQRHRNCHRCLLCRGFYLDHRHSEAFSRSRDPQERWRRLGLKNWAISREELFKAWCISMLRHPYHRNCSIWDWNREQKIAITLWRSLSRVYFVGY